MDDITEWFVSRLTLVIDNTQWMHVSAVEAAEAAVKDDMGSAPTWEQYRSMHDGRGGAAYTRFDYEHAVGQRIADMIAEWFSEALDGNGDVKLLALDVIPVQSEDVIDGLGAHYLPDPGDMTGVLEYETPED